MQLALIDETNGLGAVTGHRSPSPADCLPGTASNRQAKVEAPHLCRVKQGFHEPTEINKINHQCIQIGRWHLHTYGHRPMDYWRHCGCRLDLLFYDWSAGEVTIWVKSTVQYNDKLNHKIALKFSEM